MKDFKDYKQMENAGWENMHSLLDQHMPQKKKRFALLYFTYFIFGALMLISFLSWLNYKSIPQHTNAPKESPIAIENQKRNIESNENATLTNSLITTEKSNSQKLNSELQSAKTNYYSTNNKIDRTKFKKAKPDNAHSNFNSYSSIQDGDLNHSKNGIDQNESTSLTYQISKYEIMDIPFLPGIALSSIQLTDTDHSANNLHLPEILKPFHSKSSNKIQFGIRAGIQYFTSNKTISYFAGAQLEYKLAEKWSVSLSPNLEIKKGNFLILNDDERSLIVNSLDSFRINTDLFSDTKTEVVLSSPSSGLNSVAVERHNYLFNLQLPLTLNYQLNKHWQTSLGMKILIPLQKDLITSNKSNIIQWNDEKTNSWRVNPINYFLLAGIKYNPVYSIGIRLDYSVAIPTVNTSEIDNKSSVNPIENRTITKNHGHFSVGLHYRF